MLPDWPELDVSGGLNFKETELTLGLPGEIGRGTSSLIQITAGSSSAKLTGTKRGFSQAAMDLNLGRSFYVEHDDSCCEQSESENEDMSVAKPPAAKAQIVGWPPVRAFRRNVMTKSFNLVKVSMDGAPYLRKVDLEMYDSYQQLLSALEDMFSCPTIPTYPTRNYLDEKKLMDPTIGVEYVPTYEDKDGDLMLVGDVPWKMFVESCKRLRLIKGSEAIELHAPRTPQQSGASCTS
ncbi:auxin-responsive protein IAA1-like [Juglans microcarpa x Juglans regia]|uniref:auxin-responsive protein IAA1-like n=1 Tax=Juglans microcarpa x Juglans regia TaxID=2249226 RepID=UPI001B7E8652|nr:auxin-responsive protein IAA1-like [Juglans microcarpa x Juglans regia]